MKYDMNLLYYTCFLAFECNPKIKIHKQYVVMLIGNINFNQTIPVYHRIHIVTNQKVVLCSPILLITKRK